MSPARRQPGEVTRHVKIEIRKVEQVKATTFPDDS
jgi:hypothetical protein